MSGSMWQLLRAERSSLQKYPSILSLQPSAPLTSSRQGITGNSSSVSRRGLVAGLGAILLCSPAIVRASSLMPVKPIPQMLNMWIGGIHIAVEVYPPMTQSAAAEAICKEYMKQQARIDNLMADSIVVECDRWDPNKVNIKVHPFFAEQLRRAADLVERNLVLVT